jgi:hypothetical protein
MNNVRLIVKRSVIYYCHDIVAGKEHAILSLIFKNSHMETNFKLQKNMMR